MQITIKVPKETAVVAIAHALMNGLKSTTQLTFNKEVKGWFENYGNSDVTAHLEEEDTEGREFEAFLPQAEEITEEFYNDLSAEKKPCGFKVLAAYISSHNNITHSQIKEYGIQADSPQEAIAVMRSKIEKEKGFVEFNSISATHSVIFENYTVCAEYGTQGGNVKSYSNSIKAVSAESATEIARAYLYKRCRAAKIWTIEASPWRN